jgi:hypothetical protein
MKLDMPASSDVVPVEGCYSLGADFNTYRLHKVEKELVILDIYHLPVCRKDAMQVSRKDRESKGETF